MRKNQQWDHKRDFLFPEELKVNDHICESHFAFPWTKNEFHPLASELLNSTSNEHGYSETLQFRKLAKKKAYVPPNEVIDPITLADDLHDDEEIESRIHLSSLFSIEETDDMQHPPKQRPPRYFSFHGVTVSISDPKIIALLEQEQDKEQKMEALCEKYEAYPVRTKHRQPLSRRKIYRS